MATFPSTKIDHAPEYIRWDATGVEVEVPGEKELMYQVAEGFNKLQNLSYQETHHPMRATHLKTQGCVRGTLTINDNLPSHLAQGMFAKSGKHDVIMRYSSLPPKITPDNAHAPRGLGIKVFDVEGDKIFGEDKKTQDFTFNNYPILELRDMPGSKKLADSLVRNFNDFEKFGEEEAARPDKDIALFFGSVPKQHIVAMKQWSQGAYRYGDYVAKFGVFPLGEEQKKLETKYVQDTDPPNVLSEELRDFHSKNKVTYSFNVQLLENLKEQPVEDLGIIWDEVKYPFQQVGVLEFEPQDSYDHAFRTWFNDSGVACNPWHGLKAHQPLGSAQRVRRVVYAESRKLRLKMNGSKGYTEPASLKEVPTSA